MHLVLDEQATDPGLERIRATDLRRATALSRALKKLAGVTAVVLEIEFLIGSSARTAREEYRERGLDTAEASTVQYVGTPQGLATLIADIGAAGAADGVVPIGLDDGASAELLSTTTLPLLLHKGVIDAETVRAMRDVPGLTAREGALRGDS